VERREIPSLILVSEADLNREPIHMKLILKPKKRDTETNRTYQVKLKHRANIGEGEKENHDAVGSYALFTKHSPHNLIATKALHGKKDKHSNKRCTCLANGECDISIPGIWPSPAKQFSELSRHLYSDRVDGNGHNQDEHHHRKDGMAIEPINHCVRRGNIAEYRLNASAFARLFVGRPIWPMVEKSKQLSSCTVCCQGQPLLTTF
jgi:hypothetical protein